MEINLKDQNIERLENEKKDLANEKRTLELQFHQTRLELTALKETFQDQKIKADLATDELNIFKKKWQERELCQQNSFDSSQQIINDLQHQLQRKTEDLESMSIKHANLLISMKETKENESYHQKRIQDLEVNSEVASELAIVKQELKRLHGILAQKEKELVKAKLSEHMAENMNETMNHLKTEIINKESKLQELELTLDLERRKIETYEEHIQVLRDQIKELQNQITEVAKVKKRIIYSFVILC